MKTTFKIGDKAKCINAKILDKFEAGPNLKENDIYEVKNIIRDSKDNDHLDVGLVSHLAYVSSYETGEHLPEGNKIHWCHPSRFINI